MKTLRPLALALAAAFAPAAFGEDVYYDVALEDLPIVEGARPEPPKEPHWRHWQRAELMAPYAVLEGEGDVCVASAEPDFRWRNANRDAARVLARVPAGRPAKGSIFLAKPDYAGMVRLRFALAPETAKPEAARAFHLARERWYEHLLQRDIAGAAWFRCQARLARIAGGGAPAPDPTAARPWGARRTGDLSETYDLFTGGRAVAENLALDVALRPAAAGEELVDVSTLEGITVQAFDWKAMPAAPPPEKDRLAAFVPADQYAVFFPTFDAMLALIDEADAGGTPVLHGLAERAEDARTKDRYERQLCLSAGAFARLLGPRLIRSVAFTGSDPFLRMGTDVAILFDCNDPAPVLAHVQMKQAVEAKETEPKPPHARAALGRGEVDGVAYVAARSPDDGVRSYAAAVGDVVVVANSLHQLEAIVAAGRGKVPALSGLDEYAFFRGRYRRGDADEAAFLVVSDAAIRKWCGPQWRIADSRRTRALALLTELQARHVDAVAGGAAPAEADAADLALPAGDALVLTPDGARLRDAGGVGFLRPIAEMPPTKVTKSEAEAYRQWRRGYQENWRRWFDPIAVRFVVRSDRLAADATIMPVVAGSDYERFTALTAGAAIAPDAGDRHAGALVHGIMALNTKSEPMRQAGGFLGNMAPGLAVDPLGWIGGSVAVYADDDPFWDELARFSSDDERSKFMEKEWGRLPVGLHVEVGNALQLAAFLAAFRAFVDQTSPGMLVWENRKHQDQAYVRVGPSDQAKGQNRGMPDFAVYYLVTGKALVVSLSEPVVQRAIERIQAAASGKPAAAALPPWLGQSLGLQADRKAVQMVSALTRETYREAMQARSWGNLPILNELRRRVPAQDPVALYERLWGTRPICPGGGAYVWNERRQTMESTAYGCPAEPKPGPGLPAALDAVTSGNFGLTFEHDGVRAAVELRRAAGTQRTR